jgi:aspartyl-tRNA(Asn)/glutamyl-tRNA(Gln) amidotransferase subunit B
MDFAPVIGLEVHAQLLTKSKLFCGCSTAFDAPPNSNTCPVCLGLPGSLPVLNRAAVGMAVRASISLGCELRLTSIFARKNYFYPDLPKGFQISQFDRPLSEHGCVAVFSGERTAGGNIVNRQEKRFGITRLHLEEDAGKSIHDGMPETGRKSYVNLNRCGTPLIEIVSEPDFRSSQEAYDYVTQLRRTLLYLGVCDGNMEEGSLRCDANVSVMPRGSKVFGTKVEIKNLNSFRFLQKALDYEIRRQSELIDSGGRVVQETRLWDDPKGCTFPMRSKEEAHDYRYFPEPDLPPLKLDQGWVQELQASVPELPHAKAVRFVREYDISADDAFQLTASAELGGYFEKAAGISGNPRSAANWVMGDLAHAMKDSDAAPVSPEALGTLIQKVDSGEISGKMAKTVFEEMVRTGEDAAAVIQKLGLVQMSDEAGLLAIIEKIVSGNPKQVAEYRSGKEKVFGFFVGQAMKETRGQANPQVLNRLLLNKLRGTE